MMMVAELRRDGFEKVRCRLDLLQLARPAVPVAREKTPIPTPPKVGDRRSEIRVHRPRARKWCSADVPPTPHVISSTIMTPILLLQANKSSNYLPWTAKECVAWILQPNKRVVILCGGVSSTLYTINHHEHR